MTCTIVCTDLPCHWQPTPIMPAPKQAVETSCQHMPFMPSPPGSPDAARAAVIALPATPLQSDRSGRDYGV